MKELYLFLLVFCVTFMRVTAFLDNFIPITFQFNLKELKSAVKNNIEAVEFRLKFVKENGTNIPKMIKLEGEKKDIEKTIN